MKKLVLVAALALGSLSAFAQDAETEVQSEATEVQSEATEVQSEATEVQSEATEATEEVQSEATEATEEMEADAQEAQDSFTAIEVSEIPAAITDALAKDHPDATISSASVNAETQYKLEVTKEDGSEQTLYADAEGNWLEM
jgi:phenylalanyl-tRNA synthetase alpha subunit